jgi:hypothetical protein
MYDHECNVLKGWWHPHALDKSGPLAAGEEVLPGQVVYLDMNAEFRLGLPENSMPMFAWPGSADFDVSADVGNIQSQNLMALPVTGSYELQTTEFDERYSYHPNDHLAVWDVQKTSYTEEYKGTVYVGNPYTDTICGIVSKGVEVNDFGKNFLSLWTYYLPIDLDDYSSLTAS